MQLPLSYSTWQQKQNKKPPLSLGKCFLLTASLHMKVYPGGGRQWKMIANLTLSIPCFRGWGLCTLLFVEPCTGLYSFSLLFERKLSSYLRGSSLQINFTFLLQKMFPWNENVMTVRSVACSCQPVPLIQLGLHLLKSRLIDFLATFFFLLSLDHLYICTSQFLLHQNA